MGKLDFKGKLVVVTGASSGLGFAIARAFALDEHAHVAVAARRCDRLEGLKRQIEAACSSRVYPIPIDLGTAEGPETLFRQATRIGDVSAVVNCAGLTYFGKTLDAPAGRYEQIVSVNFVAAMKTSLLFLQYFLNRGQGAVLNVTSGAALISWPFQGVYSASKHALQAFTETLAYEYNGTGVTICAFAPGGVATEMITSSGIDRKRVGRDPFLMSPAAAARLAVRSLKKLKRVSIAGFGNKAGLTIARMLPRRFVAAVLGRAYRL
jgi:uncharacterized protein